MPIIAMTANTMAGDREKVIEAGMWDHIAKPLDIGDMFATLAKWITPRAPAPVTERARAPEATAKAFPPLPGIDVKAGIARTMNNEKLYTRMLLSFRESQAGFAALFAAARADADPTAATRAAHTLKGTAGTIGAGGVQAAAAELEHACQEGEGDARIDALLGKVLAELAPVVEGLNTLSPGSEGTAAKAPALPKAETKAALDHLAQLLSDGDGEAGEFLSELQGKLAGTELGRALGPLSVAVDKFEFDDALARLAKVRETV